MSKKLSSATPGEKLLALYTLLMLRGKKPISLASLASHLACSKQTVLRLLAQLEASGYGKLEKPLRQGKEDFYRLAPREDMLDLGAAELAQLALCRNLLIHLLPDPSSRPEGAETSFLHPAAIACKGYIDYAPFETQYARLLTAIQKRLVCRVAYQKTLQSEPREFCFAPIRLLAYRETLSLLGWEVPPGGTVKCLYANWLWLYLQRFTMVKLTKRSSAELPEINITNGGRTEFGIMDWKSFSVKLLFSARTAPYIHDRQWSSNQKMTLTEDGGLILEMEARSHPEVVSWVLGFGSQVKVLHPAWLREEVVRQAREIIHSQTESAS